MKILLAFFIQALLSVSLVKASELLPNAENVKSNNLSQIIMEELFDGNGTASALIIDGDVKSNNFLQVNMEEVLDQNGTIKSPIMDEDEKVSNFSQVIMEEMFDDNGTVSSLIVDPDIILTTTSSIYDERRICSKNSDCNENEFCKTVFNFRSGFFNLVCSCKSDSFVTTDGICKKKSKYGESCSEVQPCEDNTPLLSCNFMTNQCECSYNSTQMFDPIKERCVIRIGEECRKYRNQYNSICGMNAYCKPFPPNKPKFHKCLCLDGYKNINGNCVASFGQICNQTGNCNPEAGLICGNGKCICSSPLSEIYDPFHEECRRIIGSSCELRDNTTSEDNISHPKCVQGGICINGKCECKVGYSPTYSFPKVCKLSYLSQCRNQAKYSNQCNNERGLICKDETCQCLDSDLIFDETIESCLNEDGSFCGPFNLNENNNNGNGKKQLLQNAKPIDNNTIVVVGCQTNSICSKIQGEKTCSCLQVRIIESDKMGKVDYCSPITKL